MNLRFILSLFVAILIAGNSYANTSLGIADGLVLKGEFSDVGSRSVKPTLPMSADIISNVLYIDFSAPVGNVAVSVTGPVGIVYASTMDVKTSGEQISFSLGGLAPGVYLLEFKNSKGGYVCGEFIVD